MRLSLVAAILACSVLFSHAQEKRPGLYLMGNLNSISAEEWMRLTCDAQKTSLLYYYPGPQHSVTVACSEKGVFLPFDDFLPRCRDALAVGGYALTPGGSDSWWVDYRDTANRLLEPVGPDELNAAPPDLNVWCAVYAGNRAELTGAGLNRAFPSLSITAGERTVRLAGRAADVRTAIAALNQHNEFGVQRRVMTAPKGLGDRELQEQTRVFEFMRRGTATTHVAGGNVYARGTASDLDLLQQLLSALEK